MQHFIDFSIPTKASPNYVQQFALQISAIPVFIKDLNRVKNYFICGRKGQYMHKLILYI